METVLRYLKRCGRRAGGRAGGRHLGARIAPGRLYVLDDGVEQRGRVLPWGPARGFRREGGREWERRERRERREREKRESEREREREREKRERERERAGGKERRHAALSSSGRAVLFLSVQSSESSMKLGVVYLWSIKLLVLILWEHLAGPIERLVGPALAPRRVEHGKVELRLRRVEVREEVKHLRLYLLAPAQSLGEPSRTTLHSTFVVGRIRDALGGLGRCYERVLPALQTTPPPSY